MDNHDQEAQKKWADALSAESEMLMKAQEDYRMQLKKIKLQEIIRAIVEYARM